MSELLRRSKGVAILKNTELLRPMTRERTTIAAIKKSSLGDPKSWSPFLFETGVM
jgi:hypothetical protein